MSKHVGSTAHILASLFNSASRHHCEVWTLQYPFLQNVADTLLSSGAHLYGYINWSLAEIQQQSTIGFPLSSHSVRDDKARSRIDFLFNVKNCLCQGLVIHLW